MNDTLAQKIEQMLGEFDTTRWTRTVADLAQTEMQFSHHGDREYRIRVNVEEDHVRIVVMNSRAFIISEASLSGTHEATLTQVRALLTAHGVR